MDELEKNTGEVSQSATNSDAWDAQRLKDRDKAREWREAKAGRLSDEELQECIKDPLKAATIRGPQWVACLECGQMCKVLRSRRGHLERHGTTEESYVAKFGASVPLVSAESSAALGRAGKRADRAVAWQSSIEARKGKALAVDHRRKLGESIGDAHRRKKVTSKIPLWPKIRAGLSGLPKTAIAEQLGGHPADIYRIHHSVGIVGWPAAYRHGEVLTRNHVLQFSGDTGLNEKTSCDFIGIDYPSFTNLLNRKRDRPLSSREPQNPKSPHNGKLLNDAYDRVIDHVCFEDYKNRREVRLFLQSEVSEIPGKHAALTVVFEALGGALRSRETSSRPDAVMEWLCWRTRVERGREPFRTALFLGLVIEELLIEKPTLLQPDKFRPGALSSEILAKDYKTKPGRIDEVVVGGKHEALASSSVRIALSGILPKEKQDPGPDPLLRDGLTSTARGQSASSGFAPCLTSLATFSFAGRSSSTSAMEDRGPVVPSTSPPRLPFTWWSEPPAPPPRAVPLSS